MKSKSKLLLIIIATAFAILSFPKVSYGQVAPTLGTTSSFALFTANGAFNVTGAANVTGDVGTNVGAFTAFPPGILVGNKYVADATSAQAALDVAIAYADLTQAGSTVIGVGLGNGQTLTPGNYSTGAASTLNLNLTLDALGVSSAIFVIQIGGAFQALAGSSVTLINGASLCNVYWQIGGQLDLFAGASLYGTVIVNGAINLASGATLHGRGLSTAGAINITDNTVTFIPDAAGSVSGTPTVCQGQTAVAYSVAPINNASGYLWTLPGAPNHHGCQSAMCVLWCLVMRIQSA